MDLTTLVISPQYKSPRNRNGLVYHKFYCLMAERMAFHCTALTRLGYDYTVRDDDDYLYFIIHSAKPKDETIILLAISDSRVTWRTEWK